MQFNFLSNTNTKFRAEWKVQFIVSIKTNLDLKPFLKTRFKMARFHSLNVRYNLSAENKKLLKYIIAFQNKHWNLCSCNIMNKVVQHIHYVSISNVFIIHFEWKPFHLATNLPCKTDLSPFCGDVKPLSIRLTAQRSNFHTRILPLINKSHKKAWKQKKNIYSFEVQRHM
jgi:hypothetical protein